MVLLAISTVWDSAYYLLIYLIPVVWLAFLFSTCLLLCVAFLLLCPESKWSKVSSALTVVTSVDHRQRHSARGLCISMLP